MPWIREQMFADQAGEAIEDKTQGEFVDKLESNYTFVSATKRIIDNNAQGHLGWLQEVEETIEISGTGTCSDPQYTDQASCEAGGTCSDPQYTDEATCETALEIWTPETWALYIDFEQGEDTLYGCDWDGINKTFKNTSQKDLIVNLEPQIGRRSTGSSVALELFIDISYDDGVTWNVDINDSYAVFKDITITTSSVIPLTFRIIPNAMIRIGMTLKTDTAKTGIIAIGATATKPTNSISGRQVPSCELIIT